ncbi:LysE family translocator [Streptomyces sp. NPDC053542]|uniref:LysE family translocator n=1 Tax=Streptomyces sp. NPDC053542 TaxID=3365710 RepID=UPI0037D34FE3
MAANSIAAFWAVSVLLVLVPGADWAYAITAGLRDRSVLPAVGGLMLGYVGLTLVVVAGVAAVVANNPAVLTTLTVLGSLYLIWLGVMTLARPAAPAAPASADPSDVPAGAAPGARILKGAGISGLNPKALLLYIALLPQFAAAHGGGSGWPLAAQIAVLGLVHMANCGAVYTGVGVLARTVLRARPVVARAVTRLSGAAMILIGGLLLVERLA